MSDSSIMSVRELIEEAFGDPDKNVVDFKLVQTVLYLLAKQLRILERHVGVEIGFPYDRSSSSISVTEIKIHANVQKKGKQLPKFLLEVKASRGDLGPGPVIRRLPGAAKKQEIIRQSQKLQDTGEAFPRNLYEDQPQSPTELDTFDKEGDFKKASGGTSRKLKIGKSRDDNEDQAETYEDTVTGNAVSKSTSDKKHTRKSITLAYDDKQKGGREEKSTDKSEPKGDASPRKQKTNFQDQKSTSESDTRTDKSTYDRSSLDSVSDLSVAFSKDSDRKKYQEQRGERSASEISINNLADEFQNHVDGKLRKNRRLSEDGKSTNSSKGKDVDERSAKASTESEERSDKISEKRQRKSYDKAQDGERTYFDDNNKDSDRESHTTDQTSKPLDGKSKIRDESSSPSDATSKYIPGTPSSVDNNKARETISKKSFTKRKQSQEGERRSVVGSTVKRSESKSSTISASKTTKNYLKILEKIEEEREKVLRIIHQRTDSYEEDVRSPTPMASIDSTEVQYEKLLVVERVPSSELKSRQTGRTPRLSIVTQDEFEKLVQAVIALEKKLGPVAVPGFPDSLKLLDDIRRGASLTDAMAGLQLSARLEAAEKALEQITELLVELAKTNPMTAGLVSGQLDQILESGQIPIKSDELTSNRKQDESVPVQQLDKTIKIPMLDATETEDKSSKTDEPGIAKKQIKSMASMISGATEGSDTRSMPSKTSKISRGKSTGVALGESPVESAISLMFPTAQSEKQHVDATSTHSVEGSEKKKAFITIEELESAMRDLQIEFQKAIVSMTSRSNQNANNAIKIATLIEKKIEKSLDVGDRMTDLESTVAKYCEQINILDTDLSSQMTNYQEELTQMQHDLEISLESMAEALANLGGDTEAMSELNQYFTTLQLDFDRTRTMQKELADIQYSLSVDLNRLKKEIEILRDVKSDRDEVADALRDKAGIDSLNGLVTHHQFNAVRGDIEKNIRTAYDKFNNQEIIWQKAIEDLLREVNEKASNIQVSALGNAINGNLEMLRTRLDGMINLLGEPRAAALTRAMFRDTNCLSCASPAYMSLEEEPVLKLPAIGKRPPTLGEEDPRPQDDGDHLHHHQQSCYPGQPIPHPCDPRSQFCSRYCGGVHKVVPQGVNRIPPGITIGRPERAATVVLGQDRNPYNTDEKGTTHPCRPCNLPPMPERIENGLSNSICNTSMTPTDYKIAACLKTECFQNVSMLPATEN